MRVSIDDDRNVISLLVSLIPGCSNGSVHLSVCKDCDGIIQDLLKTHRAQTGAPIRRIDCLWL